MTRVTAPTRLHFGLLHVPADGATHWPDGLPARRFGGVGLMVMPPFVNVEAEPAKEWSADGPLADRAVGFARRTAEHLGSSTAFRLGVGCPPDHVGFGVGTQLGLATSAAVARELGVVATARELAVIVGRGERSGIGVSGFETGGLIVDGGKADSGDTSRPVARLDWPSEWIIVLARPPVADCWAGDRERAAFTRPRNRVAAARMAERLCRLVLLGLLPAVAGRDFAAVGPALHEFNLAAGAAFALEQGGPYASPAVEAIVGTARSFGVAGAGQSSWGPTTFAVCRDEDQAAALGRNLTNRFPDLGHLCYATGFNAGAAYETTA